MSTTNTTDERRFKTIGFVMNEIFAKKKTLQIGQCTDLLTAIRDKASWDNLIKNAQHSFVLRSIAQHVAQDSDILQRLASISILAVLLRD